MLLKTPLQKIFYKLFLALIALVYSFSAYVAPSDAQPIAPQQDDASLFFAALADPQVSNYILKRVPSFDAAAEDLHNARRLDAVLIAGDIAENGLAIEYRYIYEKLNGLGCPYLLAEGNHDIRLRVYLQSLARFSAFSNALNETSEMDSYHYSAAVNGYTFLVLGSDRTVFEESYLNDAQLSWLDESLASQQGRPTFVVLHQPLQNTHGLPDTWGSPFKSAGSVGKQSDRIDAILQQYDNVILITGHLHTGFGAYTYEKRGSVWMVNLPSLTINNKDGGDNGPGIGCMVECRKDEIVFRARNFATGTWLPDYDFTIPVQ